MKMSEDLHLNYLISVKKFVFFFFALKSVKKNPTVTNVNGLVLHISITNITNRISTE